MIMLLNSKIDVKENMHGRLLYVFNCTKTQLIILKYCAITRKNIEEALKVLTMYNISIISCQGAVKM